MGIFSNEPQFDVHASASFPESNPFGLIVNGEQNQLLISVANSGAKNYTLLSASASYHDVNNNWALIKNASTSKYGIPLVSGTNFTVPYQLYSEFRPREIGLTVWVNMAEGASPKTVIPVTAYNQTASVVEPASSVFDPQLIFMYLILTAALAGGAYWAYNTFFASAPTRRSGGKRRSGAAAGPSSGEKKAVVAADQSNQAYPDVKPYEEEWIPSHHLKSKGSKLRKRGTAGGASSAGEDGVTSGGDATSGGEASGPESAARAKKGKGKRA